MAAREPIQTLVFLDLETSGLIGQYDRHDPRNPPPFRAGDTGRDVQKIFQSYAQSEKVPRVLELSMVALPKSRFLEWAQFMRGKHRRNEADFRVLNPSASVLTLQFDPMFSADQWQAYENRNQAQYTNLHKEDLVNRMTFAHNWPIVECFLSSMPGRVALIAHNGLGFDFRVLYRQLRDHSLTDSRNLSDKLVFLDSLFAFKDLDKQHLDYVCGLVRGINWRNVTPCPKRARAEPDELTESLRPEAQPEERGSDPEGTGFLRSSVLVSEDGDRQVDDFADEVLKRPAALGLRTPVKARPAPNQGWKTAPAAVFKRGILENCAPTNPVNFMNTDHWSPAQMHRLLDEFFVRRNDDSWDFCLTRADAVFYKKGMFKLPTLYDHIFRQKYDAHRAQEDAFALLQVCLAYGEQFVKYLEKQAVPLPGFLPTSEV